MDTHTLQQFRQLVAQRIGLQLREQESDFFRKTLNTRLKTLKLSEANEYFTLLSDKSTQGEAEWRQLSILLTNQESYFFRDQKQFELLRHHILPELIQTNKARKTLRIWSAGCSTGQEPYSLAILVDLLLPFHADWEIFILGTDLSEAALEKAREGVFAPWSFRSMESELQERYFHRHQGQFALNERIRKMVTFRHNNLFQDQFPLRSSDVHEMDLILCRNVFIYFQRDAVAMVLKKFEQTLREDAYLLTGHAELHDAPLGNLLPRIHPGTIIYQKNSHSDAPPRVQMPPAQPPRVQPAPPRPVEVSRQSASPSNSPLPAKNPIYTNGTIQAEDRRHADAKRIQSALAMSRSGNVAAALTELAPLLISESPHFAALCLAAQGHANAGQYDQALRHCRQATAIEPFAPLPFHIQARIAEERGEREETKLLLKKVNYLAPSLPIPYLELAAIYEHEGDKPRAGKMRATALGLLNGLTPEQPVPTDALSTDRVMTVAELRAHLRASGPDELSSLDI